jgi:hypothetical protein
VFLGSKKKNEYRLKRAILSLKKNLALNSPINEEDKNILNQLCNLILNDKNNPPEKLGYASQQSIKSIKIQYFKQDGDDEERSFQDRPIEQYQTYLLKKAKLRNSRIEDLVTSIQNEKTIQRYVNRVEKRIKAGGHWYQVEELSILQSAYGVLIQKQSLRKDKHSKIIKKEEHTKIINFLTELYRKNHGEKNLEGFRTGLLEMRTNLENIHAVTSRLARNL